MYQVQKFAIDHIYRAPSQDRQFSFKPVRVNKKQFPVKRKVDLYNTTKNLPNQTSYFHVFVIGNIPPSLLNLLGQQERWFKDVWVKVSDDMVERDYIFKMYNTDGVVYPRSHLYYSYIDESSIAVALEVLPDLRNNFDIESFVYINVYSNAFFQTADFAASGERIGIDHRLTQVSNNTEKVQLQNFIAERLSHGGDVFIYVNGFYTETMNLNIPDYSHVEIVYDQSIADKEYVPIQNLRTFDSTLDDRLKYLIYRDKQTSTIQYQDDCEVYIRDEGTLVAKGLYFYKHKALTMRNVTDKDFSLASSYVNATAQRLSELTTGSLSDKTIVLYTRRSGRDMPLKYSGMKLHELYKLPHDVQLNVVSNNNYTVDILRAEQLENSAYFKIASAAKLSLITPALATEAVGYSGMAYYYANTPVKYTGLSVDVPELYQMESVAFEYDAQGLYLGRYVTNGPLYTATNPAAAFVDFTYGHIPVDFGRLYEPTETVSLQHNEFVVLSAYFAGATRESNWEDISQTNKVTLSGMNLTLNEVTGKKVKIVYLNHLNVYDLDVDLTGGRIHFPLTVKEDRGTGVQTHIADVPYRNIELYLNNRRLTQGLDFFLEFPYVSICSKKYLNYALPAQKLHVRMSGYTLDKNQINEQEVRGFVNNGVLTRNKKYDIRDDRVYSVFIDGKLYDRDSVMYSEEDNTVRLGHPKNGLPYTLKEPFIPMKRLTGTDTIPLYEQNLVKNKKISDLYNLVFPEPSINDFNVIGATHTLFSPTVSKVVNDILTGVIAESVYSSPYDDSTILSLIDNQYKELFLLDPVRLNVRSPLVTIHPHIGNSTITLNLLQYRFVSNLIKLITNNQPDRINLSGYLAVST